VVGGLRIVGGCSGWFIHKPSQHREEAGTGGACVSRHRGITGFRSDSPLAFVRFSTSCNSPIQNVETDRCRTELRVHRDPEIRIASNNAEAWTALESKTASVVGGTSRLWNAYSLAMPYRSVLHSL